MDYKEFVWLAHVGDPLGLSFCFCGVFLVAFVYVEFYKE